MWEVQYNSPVYGWVDLSTKLRIKMWPKLLIVYMRQKG